MSAVWNFIARIAARPAVTAWLIERAARTPYSPIVKGGDVYMRRYWLFNPYPDSGASGADRKPWRFPISIRLHHIMLPDQDRDLHDHPWNARTIILRGWYKEARQARIAQFDHVPSEHYHKAHRRCAGETATLAFGEYHRITAVSPDGVWTLFITGKYRGTWGFLVGGAKVQWRKYLGLDAK